MEEVTVIVLMSTLDTVDQPILFTYANHQDIEKSLGWAGKVT